MKKLFIYALLLVTGFAFYSCDDRFDNPVTQQQDASNPYSTWTYEVKIDFADVNISYWDEEAEEAVYYEEPTTVWVYNQKFEKLGFLTADDEDTPEKFAGILKGSIGDTLIISSIEDFDYISKQDGTLKSIIDNKCILQTAKVPIIIANATTGKIGTQKVQMENATKVFASGFGDYGYTKSIEISSDNLFFGSTEDKSFKVNCSEDAVKNYYTFISMAFDEDEVADYRFDLVNEDAGFKAYGINEEAYYATYSRNRISYVYPEIHLSSIDLTKYYAFKKSLVEDAPEDWYLWMNIDNYDKDLDVEVSQSGEDALPIRLSIRAPKVTLNGINIRYAQFNGNSSDDPDYCFGPTITLKGDNFIGKDNNDWTTIWYDNVLTFKGDGSLTLLKGGNNNNYSFYQWGQTYGEWDAENETWIYKPVEIIIEEKAKLIAKQTIVLGTGNDKPESVTINGGSLEVTGNEGNPAIYLYGGKITVGEGGTLKATSGQDNDNPFYILEYDMQHGWASAEAKLENIVKDPTKFDDTTDNTTKTRTIKKK